MRRGRLWVWDVNANDLKEITKCPRCLSYNVIAERVLEGMDNKLDITAGNVDLWKNLYRDVIKEKPSLIQRIFRRRV